MSPNNFALSEPLGTMTDKQPVEEPRMEDRRTAPPLIGEDLIGEDTRCARCGGSVVPGSMLCRACLSL